MPNLLWDNDNEKSGALDGTTRLIVAVRVRLPDLPVTVMLEVPVVAVLVADSVKLLADFVLAGEKDAVTPAGRPAAVRLTLPVKPNRGATDIVAVLLLPRTTVMFASDEPSLKSATDAEVPASASIRLWPAGLPQPVTRS